MSYGPRPWIQLHWDARAALNFILGGTGSGFILFAAFVPLSPHQGQAALLIGLALVAAGLTAVWMETGRKLRAVHVFFNPMTSWKPENVGLPLHPGAERAYREKGWMK